MHPRYRAHRSGLLRDRSTLDMSGGTIEFSLVPPRDAALRLGEQLDVRMDLNGNFLALELRGTNPVLIPWCKRAPFRVSVAGEVTRPGFYAVPIDLVLADALMLAGGATKDARVDQLRVVGGSSSLWSGDKLQTAIARGATLEDLGIRGGDRIQVPGQRDPESKWRIVGLVVTSLATAVGVVALTHHH